ncbi:MAG: TIR domain-containing protein, partial [Anaerolineae bacterium]|nr:TIR domain-containing protein [Anaerolineae bacterium]
MNPASLVGKKIGQYEIQELIGQGGLSTVYRAYHAPLDRTIALKIYNLPIAPANLATVNAEVEKVARLEHPHLIPIFDYGVSGEQLYLTLRLMDVRLASRLRRGWQASYDEISAIITRVASALDYLHQRGIIHRDVNPANIFLDAQGTAYLGNVLDTTILGMSHMGAEAHTPAQMAAIGTPSYMSPEQWRSEPLTGASDQYALGIVAYRLVAGRVPFDGDTPFQIMHQQLTEQPTPLESHLSAAQAVLFKAMAQTPAERYPTVTAFAKELASALSKQVMPPVHQVLSPAKNAPSTAPSPPPAPVVTKSTHARKVFISYSTRDRVLMERLAHDLEGMGHRVWYDRELQNRGGQSWWDMILEQIRQAELFIFSLTPESLASEPCSREYGYAAALGKQILPVRLAPMKTDMLPPALLQIQWVDYLDAQKGQAILIESIDHLPQAPALPSPLP